MILIESFGTAVSCILSIRHSLLSQRHGKGKRKRKEAFLTHKNAFNLEGIEDIQEKEGIEARFRSLQHSIPITEQKVFVSWPSAERKD